MTYFDYDIVPEIEDFGETTNDAQCLCEVRDNDGTCISYPGLSWTRPNLYTKAYDEDEESFEYTIDDSNKTEFPGLLWPYRGTALQISNMLIRTKNMPSAGEIVGPARISIFVYDSTSTIGQCLKNVGDFNGSQIGGCVGSISNFGNVTNNPHEIFYLNQEKGEVEQAWDGQNAIVLTDSDEEMGVIDDGWIDWIAKWDNLNLFSSGDFVGVSDFPTNTHYSKIHLNNTDPSYSIRGYPEDSSGVNEGDVDSTAYTNISWPGIWKDESYAGEIIPKNILTYSENHDDESIIVVVRTGVDYALIGGSYENTISPLFYKFEISKQYLEELMTTEEYDRIIFEWGDYYSLDFPESAGKYLGTPNSFGFDNRGSKIVSMNREMAGMATQDILDYGYHCYCTNGSTSVNGSPTLNCNNLYLSYTDYPNQPVTMCRSDALSWFNLRGFRIILYGPNAIDRTIYNQSNSEEAYDIDWIYNNWSEELDPPLWDPEDIDDIIFPPGYTMFNPENYVDYISFSDDTRPTERVDNFRPISDIVPIIDDEEVNEDEYPSMQSYYDFGVTEYELLTSPIRVKLSFDISNSFTDITEIEDYKHKFAVLSWENGVKTDGQMLAQAMADFGNPFKTLSWQEVYDGSNKGEIHGTYHFGGIKTIHAFMFSYATGHRLEEYSNYIQPMRWKYVRIKLLVTPGLTIIEDFNQVGGKDFTTIPWELSKTPIISGISTESNYYKSIASTINGGHFSDIFVDYEDYLKLVTAYENDELGDWIGKVNIEQVRTFIGPRDMHELLMINPVADPVNITTFTDPIGADIGLSDTDGGSANQWCDGAVGFLYHYISGTTEFEATARKYCEDMGFDNVLEWTQGEQTIYGWAFYLSQDGTSPWSCLYDYAGTDYTSVMESITCFDYSGLWYPYTDIYDPINNTDGHWGDYESESPNYFDENTCVGTLYISENTNKDLKGDCIIEFNMWESSGGAVYDTSGNANYGILLGDYGVEKPSADMKMRRDTTIKKPKIGTTDKAL